MHSTLVRAACDHRTIRIRLRHWFNRGYRLLAMSSTPTFKGGVFTIEQVIKSLESGVTMHLYHERDRSSVTVSRNDDGGVIEGHESLMFAYEAKSCTNLKPLSKARPSRISSGISAY